MKRKLVFMTVMMSLNSLAGLPGKLSTIACIGDIEKVVKKANSTDKWFRTVDPQENVFAYRTPTSKLGIWVEIQSFPNPYVFIYDSKKTRVYQWNAKTCETMINSDVKPLEFLNNKKATFTDEALKKLVEAEKKSMIYIWSPTMVYSVKEMSVFRQVAKELGLNFIPILDYADSAKEAQNVINNYQTGIKVEKFRSVELYMREGTNHFPSTFIVGHNKISKKIFGVLNHEMLTTRVNKELIDISADGEGAQ